MQSNLAELLAETLVLKYHMTRYCFVVTILTGYLQILCLITYTLSTSVYNKTRFFSEADPILSSQLNTSLFILRETDLYATKGIADANYDAGVLHL